MYISRQKKSFIYKNLILIGPCMTAIYYIGPMSAIPTNEQPIGEKRKFNSLGAL